MCHVTLNIHNVNQVKVKADSAFSAGQGCYWQTFVFIDRQGNELFELTAYLDNPGSALAIGQNLIDSGTGLNLKPIKERCIK